MTSIGLPQDGAKTVSEAALQQIFTAARTFNAWQDRPVSDELLHQLYDLAKMGPTSANGSPARFVFVKGEEGKARLLPCVAAGNLEKTRTAPVTAIVAYDLEFHEKLPYLFPHMDMRRYFVGNDALIAETASRNSALQGAYLMIAARALGLDCGPMSGFDTAKLDAEFFPDGKWRANFLCNLGYGDASALFPRSPRLSFEEACLII